MAPISSSSARPSSYLWPAGPPAGPCMRRRNTAERTEGPRPGRRSEDAGGGTSPGILRPLQAAAVQRTQLRLALASWHRSRPRGCPSPYAYPPAGTSARSGGRIKPDLGLGSTVGVAGWCGCCESAGNENEEPPCPALSGRGARIWCRPHASCTPRTSKTSVIARDASGCIDPAIQGEIEWPIEQIM
jgi:hypothetical protein